jgi:hypothetical protein
MHADMLQKALGSQLPGLAAAQTATAAAGSVGQQAGEGRVMLLPPVLQLLPPSRLASGEPSNLSSLAPVTPATAFVAMQAGD